MSFLDEYGADLATLAVYAVGIAMYTLLIAFMYVPLSTRMMFAKRLGERQVATAGRRFAYVLLFPLMSFAFFLLIAASMLFMGSYTTSADLSERDIMTIAMAVVLAIRVCAYFSEVAAVDLAKTMPLSMLAVILVINGFGDLDDSLQRMRAFGDDLPLLALFFLVVVVTEGLLRLVYELLGRPHRDKPHPSR